MKSLRKIVPVVVCGTAAVVGALVPAGTAQATGPRSGAPASMWDFGEYCGSGYGLVAESADGDVEAMMFRSGNHYCGIALNRSGTRQLTDVIITQRQGSGPITFSGRDRGNYALFAGPVYATVPHGSSIQVNADLGPAGHYHGAYVTARY